MRVAALLLSLALPGTPAFALTITWPLGGDVPQESALPVRVEAALATSKVRASVGGISKDLVYVPVTTCPPRQACFPFWGATLDLGALTRGTHELVVTEITAAGETLSASRTFVLDRKPVITLEAPAFPRGIARRYLQVKATCADDDPGGCVSLAIEGSAKGNPAIDTVLDVSGSEGTSPFGLQVVGRDGRNQVGSVSLGPVIESSPYLKEVTSVPGIAIDVRDGRVLYAVSTPTQSVWRIRDLATGGDSDILPRAIPLVAGLTLAGAAAIVLDDTLAFRVMSHEGGVARDLGTANTESSLKVKGRYLLWWDGRNLRRRDVVAGTEILVSAAAIDKAAEIASNGAVAFIEEGGILGSRQADGLTVRLVPPAGGRYQSPRTDGVSVLYTAVAADTSQRIMLLRDGTERPLTGPMEGSMLLSYLISNGWILLTRGTDELQAWRIGADGKETELRVPRSVSIGPEHRVVEWLGDDGAAVVGNATRRYFTRPEWPDGTLLDFSSRNVSLVGSDPLPFVARLSSVFAVAPGVLTPTPGILLHRTPARTASRMQSVSVRNHGAATVTVGSVAGTAPFGARHDCSTLAPQASCTVNVWFQPSAAGSATGTLTLLAGGFVHEVPLVGMADSTLVPHYYRTVLRREPDEAGKAFWEAEAARVRAIGADGNEAWHAMAMGFFGSTEYSTRSSGPEDFVGDLYSAFLNRAPDKGGLAYWTGQLAAGMPREVVLAGFMFSPEFAAFAHAVTGATSARAEANMVSDFYRGLLARLPDSAGFLDWLRAFRAAQCQGAAAVAQQAEAVSAAFANSPEYAGRSRTNAQFVGDLYNTFMRRGGDLAGVLFWLGRLDSGAISRDEMRRAFIASPEFGARVAAVAAEGCMP